VKDIEFKVHGLLSSVFRELLDDCVVTRETIHQILDEAMSSERKPREREPTVEPEPSIVYANPLDALKAMLEAEFETTSGMMDDRVCFYCGSMLDYEPHSSCCSYRAAKAFVDGLEESCPTSSTPAT